MSGSHELWLETVNAVIGDTPRTNLLDLCCGQCGVTRFLGEHFGQVMGVDVQPMNLFIPFGWTYLRGNVVNTARELVEQRQRFAVAVCSDGLEHLTWLEGKKLLILMAKLAHVSIVFVPSGENPKLIRPFSDDPHDHKAIWTEADFHELGWETKAFPLWHESIGLGAIFAWKKT